MTDSEIELDGIPYVPGSARGALQRELSADMRGRIVMLQQSELGSFTELPTGFVVIEGAPLSHRMIPLLGTGVPTVIISAEQAKSLREGTEVTIDGASGRVSSDITGAARMAVSTETATAPVTVDGVQVQLRVSARDCVAAQRASECGAESIGLVRSEFFMPADGRVPDADFYRREFQALCKAAAPLPVTIRLVDIAADKLPVWLPPIDGVGGALGLQGVRLFAMEPVHSVYRAQLAAIDDLSKDFDLRVLIPYPLSCEELSYWTAEIRAHLSRPLAIGAMAETPAAALQISDWLNVVDFVALGCNDLMQCLFGADRDQPALRRYLDPFAPALFRFLRQVAEAAQGHLQQIQVCGVLSQFPGIMPLLLGLGLRVFSVEAASLSYLRRTIAATSAAEARVLLERVCAASESRRVRELLGLHG